jgi:hypothetical protein
VTSQVFINFNRFQDVTMEFVLMFYRFDFSTDGKYVAFLWVKHLFPLLLTYWWFV